MSATKRIAEALSKSDSEASERRYAHEQAGRAFEEQAAKIKGRKPPRHDAAGIENLVKALMK